MKSILFVALVLGFGSAFAAPAGFVCKSLPTALTIDEKIKFQDNIGFTLGKLAADGRSGVFEPADQATSDAVKSFFHTADYIDDVEFTEKTECTKGTTAAGDYEVESTSKYILTGVMFDLDYSFCPTKLEVTQVLKGAYASGYRSTFTAVYKPNTNPDEKDGCALADGYPVEAAPAK